MNADVLRSLWQDDVVLNGWLTIPSSISADIMVRQGWDSMTVDLQHGQMGYETAVSMLRAISCGGAVPVARVAWLEPGAIMRAMDGGASAIICPMISDRDEAERFVRISRYPPEGYRSVGSSTVRQCDAGMPATERVVTLAMLETSRALERMEDIMRVDGLDAVYVGPADLGLSLGHPPRVGQTHPDVMEALRAVSKEALRLGIPSGVHCGTTDFAEQMAEMGFKFLTLQTDNALLGAASAAAVSRGRAFTRRGTEPSRDGASTVRRELDRRPSD